MRYSVWRLVSTDTVSKRIVCKHMHVWLCRLARTTNEKGLTISIREFVYADSLSFRVDISNSTLKTKRPSEKNGRETNSPDCFLLFLFIFVFCFFIFHSSLFSFVILSVFICQTAHTVWLRTHCIHTVWLPRGQFVFKRWKDSTQEIPVLLVQIQQIKTKQKRSWN